MSVDANVIYHHTHIDKSLNMLLLLKLKKLSFSLLFNFSYLNEEKITYYCYCVDTYKFIHVYEIPFTFDREKYVIKNE